MGLPSIWINYLLGTVVGIEKRQLKYGKQDFVGTCNENNVAARHYLCGENFYVDGHWRKKTDTDWMLFNEILVLHAPWHRMSEQEFKREFGKRGINGYIKDFLNRHDGEVVQTSGDWKYDSEPMPKDAAAWHKQFATAVRDRLILASQKSITEKMRLVNHTTVLYPAQGGHMRREGRQITLGELMMELGSHYTLMEIYDWYYHAEHRRAGWMQAAKTRAWRLWAQLGRTKWLV